MALIMMRRPIVRRPNAMPDTGEVVASKPNPSAKERFIAPSIKKAGFGARGELPAMPTTCASGRQSQQAPVCGLSTCAMSGPFAHTHLREVMHASAIYLA